MAKILKIYNHQDPILRTKCRDVLHMEHWVLNLADDMWMTMLTLKAVGLAANQVGYDYRIITINGKQFQGPMINPVIVAQSKDTFHFQEGCLSAVGYGLNTGKRSQKIKVTYFDLEGKPQVVELTDMDSVIVQHEVDHLEGVIFLDHLDRRLYGK